ncbi:dipeptidyl peptidase 3-like isoform X1 [Homalodisca vitripennis]|uniref:dipeptidyl peptidase 3-like isoform X1 n=2 Tax=Homalodisca vitripennis TaxID=197043 RepID=UPI001EEB2A29|nr:dipeptidyl peptidase 3-like isoform X1 [Homalodisca vitripennis]
MIASTSCRTLLRKWRPFKINTKTVQFVITRSVAQKQALKLTPLNSKLRMTVKDHILPNDQPISELECEVAFNALTDSEKLYAHYLSQASWEGGLITAVQTSPESPLIFSFLFQLLSGQPLSELKEKALEKVTEDEYTALLVYACGVFANSGNYKGFGDSKIIPGLPQEKLEEIVQVSGAYSKQPKLFKSLWDNCKSGIYSLNDKDRSLGFWDKV